MGMRTHGEDEAFSAGGVDDPRDPTQEIPRVEPVTVDEAPPVDDTPADDEAPTKKRVWAGKRLVALIASVAVVSLLAGVVIMRFIVSPAELAARTEAPDAGPVTAPVEERVIENTILARGEVAYADSVDVKLDSPSSEGRVIITGQVPEVGKVFNAGDVALEVSGRPVIVLSGELPAYRSLSIGMSGPDVLQLKQALAELGLTSGDLSTQTFDANTAQGLSQLYQRAGYSAPTGGDAAQDELENAKKSVRAAETAVTLATNTVNQTYNSQTKANSDRVNAINARQGDVNNAENAYTNAYNAWAADPNEATRAAVDEADAHRQAAYAALNDAKAVPETPVDVTAEQAQLQEAKDSRTDAYAALTRAEEAVLPSLPSSEVLFLSSLPRRVDDVMVQRGGTLSETAMTVSGATLSIQGTFSEQDAKLLQVGMVASYSVTGGEALQATISSIEAPGSGNSQGGTGNGMGDAPKSDRYTVTFDPGELTDEQITELRGSNVKLEIPIASTDGTVLAVPLAALSAGPDGSDRVELLVPTKNDPFATEVIKVTAGLAAGGYVEVTSDDSRIAAGAKVVVGR